MDWIFIIIAVIGLISSLINKADKAQPNQRRPVRRPTSNRTEPLDMNYPENYPGPMKTRTLQNYQLDQKPSKAPYTVKKGEGISGGEGLRGTEGISGGEGISSLAKNMIEETEGLILEQTDKNNQINPAHPLLENDPQGLIKGIMWSEILSPPRSKRPHRTMNYKKI